MSKNHTTDWHAKRAALMQEACERLSAEVAAGRPALVAAREISKRYHGRRLSPARRLLLAPRTLLRAWRKWKREERTPAAFALSSGYEKRGGKSAATNTPEVDEKRAALKIGEAAWAMNTTPRKVRRLIEEGKLLAIDISTKRPDDPTSKKRHLRVPFSSIAAWKKGREG